MFVSGLNASAASRKVHEQTGVVLLTIIATKESVIEYIVHGTKNGLL